MNLYLNDSDVRSTIEQVRVGTGNSSSMVDEYLCRTLIAWGLILGSDKTPSAICESLSLYLEAQASIMIEQNSLPKFFVSSPPFRNIWFQVQGKTFRTDYWADL